MKPVVTCLILFISLLLLSCNSSQTREKELDTSSIKEPLMEVNKKVVATEDQQIRNLIDRYGWKMTKTGTGLRYLVYSHGNGDLARKGQLARIKYEIRLITGDMVYSSNETGLKEFIIGRGGVESGLEEAILLLHQGDKAKLILPSHLAHGLTGDQERIPPKSTLVYDLEVIDLKNNP
jgi:FKBP-type peptidyl-prolyl cis-trans isomerase FkpA